VATHSANPVFFPGSRPPAPNISKITKLTLFKLTTSPRLTYHYHRHHHTQTSHINLYYPTTTITTTINTNIAITTTPKHARTTSSLPASTPVRIAARLSLADRPKSSRSNPLYTASAKR
jgi:hypothetical protein